MSTLTISQTLLDSTVAALRVQARAPGGDLVCLHGFTQNRFAMVRTLVAPLATRYRSIWFLDCPGHGSTPVDEGPPRAFFETLATTGAGIDVIGYSMGARLGLWFVSLYPEVARRAAIASGHLGLQGDQARAARLNSDAALADRLARLPYAAGLGARNSEFVAFLKEWNQAPLFGKRTLSDADLRLRLLNNPANLAGALRSYGTGQQPDLTEPLRTTNTKILYLYGEHDHTYASMAERARQLPSCTVEMIADAAHDLLHDQPRKVAHAVTAFLSS